MYQIGFYTVTVLPAPDTIGSLLSTLSSNPLRMIGKICWKISRKVPQRSSSLRARIVLGLMTVVLYCVTLASVLGAPGPQPL